MKKVLIVIPTYNEARNIRPLTLQIISIFKKTDQYQPEIVFADDYSTDGTEKAIFKMQKTHSNIHLTQGEKAGLGRAYTRGLQYGMSLGPSYAVVMMDADLSHTPKSIPSMLAQLERGADFVVGSRYVAGGGTSDNWPLFRLMQSRLANYLAKLLLGMDNNVKDLTSGFKTIKRTALEKVPLESIPASGYVYQVNQLFEFYKRNFKIVEVPIIFEERKNGKSKLGSKDIIEFVFLSYKLNPDSTPRKILRFGLVGACGTLVNLAVLAFGVNILNLSPMIAIIVAIEISIISNFFLNHLYTFRAKLDSSKNVARKLIKYNAIALGGAAITYACFALGFKVLGLHYLLADLLAIVLAMSWNYIMSVHIVWNVTDKDIEETSSTIGLKREFKTEA